MKDKPMRLVVVSNRLPVALRREENGWNVTPGAGGLVTALAPVLKNRGGLWIGWSGTPVSESDEDARIGREVDDILAEYSREAGYSLHSVRLDEGMVEGYYHGFSNEIIWPLFHDFQSRCRFEPDHWRSYLDVNFRFAEQVARHSQPEDYVWVHDYHLMHVAFFLRAMGARRKTGFFLHIPFPPPDIFFKLPWRWKLINALLDFDQLGFQTMRDRKNFIQCVHGLIPESRIKGRGAVVTCELGGREIRLGAFPISIDYHDFADIAAQEEVARQSFSLKETLKHRKLILGVDRLDYTKGIPERLKSVREVLKRYPDLKEKFNFIQVVVPSREGVGEYQDLKLEIEQLVGAINGEFSVPGWVPVQYMYRNLPREELVAFYSACDIALVTPLRDGMNLVAKEYCACNLSENGVLFLSEFAGAAAQLQKYAVLVNPHDVEGVARTIRRAFYWDNTDRRHRMQRLRDSVRRHNIYWWVDSFLEAAISKHLEDFPSEDTVRFPRS